MPEKTEDRLWITMQWIRKNNTWITMMARRHIKIKHYLSITWYNHTTTVLWPFFRDHPGEPVPEENFWTLWCKGRLTKADTQTIRLGATPSGLTSAHLHHPPFFLQAGCPSCRHQQCQSTESNQITRHKKDQNLRRSSTDKIILNTNNE